MRLENNPIIPLYRTDLMWELALPIGVERDHEYCNLRAGNWVEKLVKMKEHGWRVLVSGNGSDPLVDRDTELPKLMDEKGMQVVKDFEEEGFRGIELLEPSKAKHLIALVKGFIYSICA